ncbi:response regulator transcription factor [Methylomagnum sp.]
MAPSATQPPRTGKELHPANRWRVAAMNPEPTVFVVDNDEDMRNSLKWLVESIGLPVEAFSSAEAFLDANSVGRPGCLLLDVRMPGMGGLRLLEHLRATGAGMPVIVLTGHGEVSMAVYALKCGAFDFMEKPASHQLILERVRDALVLDRENRVRASELVAFEKRLDQLTSREREVMERLVEGDNTKTIATNLDISERTVEKHRERLMSKMEIKSLAQLVRMVMEYQKGG